MWYVAGAKACLHCRLAEGVELRDAMLELKALQHEPGYADKFYGACKLVMRQLFVVRRAASGYSQDTDFCEQQRWLQRWLL